MKDQDRISRSGATVIFFVGIAILIFGGAPGNSAALMLGALLVFIAFRV